MLFLLLYLAIPAACLIHFMRHGGRNPLWLSAIIFLPMIGSAAYFFVEILPELRYNRHLRTARQRATAKLDPEREVRAAREALGLTDTIANRIRLADALAATGKPGEAIPLYRAAIDASRDPDHRTQAKLARALHDNGDAAGALGLLDAIPVPVGQSEADRLALLRARALDHLDRKQEALAILEDVVTRMPGEEARCRYAALLLETGDTTRARQVLEEVEDRMKRLDRVQRQADATMYRWAGDRLRELRARD